ncbi:radical SAM protein [Candidatus Woesearchaeota archaeon]|nr:radical SAM protein [Candidatus Woesearchaeota archaeon]
MRICLVQCPAWGNDTPPLGIASLSAVLRSDPLKRHDVYAIDFNNEFFRRCKEKETFDLTNENFWIDEKKVRKILRENRRLVNDLIEKIMREDPDVVGFSVQSSSRICTKIVAEQLKDKAPGLSIILGGCECRRNHSGLQLASLDFIDAIFTGEAEKSILLYLDMISSRRGGERKEDAAQEPIQGIIMRDDAGKILDGGEPDRIENLDALPFPDFSDFNLLEYNYPNVLPIMSSRGCVNFCFFCTERLLNRGFRHRSGDRMFEEVMHQMKKHPGVNQFDFHDSLVNGDPVSLGRFAGLVIENGLKITWNGQATIKKYMTEEYCRKLKMAGCGFLGYGIESGSDKVLKAMNKPFTPALAAEILRNTWKTGIGAGANFMFGYPGEGEEEFQETLKFLENNHEFIECVNPSLGLCGIGEGTILMKTAEERGVDLTNGSMYWQTQDGKNDFLVRLERHKRFCKLAKSLGIRINMNYNSGVYKGLEEAYLSFLEEKGERKGKMSSKRGLLAFVLSRFSRQ